MRENRIRTIWKAGGAVVNGWLSIPNAFSTEAMAHQGGDSLTVDLQHAGSTPAQFRTLIDSDRRRYAKIIQERGITAE